MDFGGGAMPGVFAVWVYKFMGLCSGYTCVMSPFNFILY